MMKTQRRGLLVQNVSEKLWWCKELTIWAELLTSDATIVKVKQVTVVGRPPLLGELTN